MRLMAASLSEYVAGAIGGAAGIFVGHPFDTTKVQLQTKQTAVPYKNMRHAIKAIYGKNSFLGFYRGIAFPLASYGVVNSVYFGTYGNALRFIKNNDGTPASLLELNLAGCIGGVAMVLVACPSEVVKVTLQSQLPENKTYGAHYYKNSVHCFTHLVKTQGIQSCYRGLTIQMWRDVPSSGIYFTVYEKTNAALIRLKFTDSRRIVPNLLAGGLAGVLSWLSVMPLDVVKSIYQSGNHNYKGFFDCARSLYKQCGWKAFFAGSTITALRAFPVNAVTFAVYNQCLTVFQSF